MIHVHHYFHFHPRYRGESKIKKSSPFLKMVCRSEGEDYLYSNVAYASSEDTDDMPLLERADADQDDNRHFVVNPAEEDDNDINNDQRTQNDDDEYYRELLEALSNYYTAENTTLRQSVLFPSTQDLSPPPLRRQIHNQLLSEVLYENMRSMFQYINQE